MFWLYEVLDVNFWLFLKLFLFFNGVGFVGFFKVFLVVEKINLLYFFVFFEWMCGFVFVLLLWFGVICLYDVCGFLWFWGWVIFGVLYMFGIFGLLLSDVGFLSVWYFFFFKSVGLFRIMLFFGLCFCWFLCGLNWFKEFSILLFSGGSFFSLLLLIFRIGFVGVLSSFFCLIISFNIVVDFLLLNLFCGGILW